MRASRTPARTLYSARDRVDKNENIIDRSLISFAGSSNATLLRYADFFNAKNFFRNKKIFVQTSLSAKFIILLTFYKVLI